MSERNRISRRSFFSFEDHEGLYLVHCHNLEHEDLGLMRNYLVAA